MDADRTAEKEAKEDARRKVVAALLKANAGKGEVGFDPMALLREPKKPPVTPIWGTRG